MKNLFTLFLFTLFPLYLVGQFTPLIFNFDTTESVYIDTSLANNIWQIGQPQKTYFDSSYSLPKAIITDTINPYSINNISEFIVKTPTYIGGWGGVNMRFYHKFDTDTLVDGGTILVSNDGLTWVNILVSPAFTLFPGNYYSLTDSVSSLNDIGFSGKSDGWQQTFGYWNYPPSDTLWIKFKFASDGQQTNKEGWMIDNLMFIYDLGIGFNDINSSADYQLKPNPFNNQAILTLNQYYDKAQVYIFSSVGQLVKSINSFKTNQVVIERGNLEPGIYSFLVVNKKKQVANGLFVVK